MKTKQKFIPAITFFIALFALFISGCSSPEVTESDDEITEGALEECDTLSGRKPLTLIIKNLVSSKGPVTVAFYQSKHKFLSKTDRLKRYKFVSDGTTLTARINDLSYGEFAIATYQDVNSDGECNRNFIGVPKEPYGFSNDYKPTVKPPSFADCMFAYNENADTLYMAMIR